MSIECKYLRKQKLLRMLQKVYKIDRMKLREKICLYLDVVIVFQQTSDKFYYMLNVKSYIT